MPWIRCGAVVRVASADRPLREEEEVARQEHRRQQGRPGRRRPAECVRERSHDGDSDGTQGGDAPAAGRGPAGIPPAGGGVIALACLVLPCLDLELRVDEDPVGMQDRLGDLDERHVDRPSRAGDRAARAAAPRARPGRSRRRPQSCGTRDRRTLRSPPRCRRGRSRARSRRGRSRPPRRLRRSSPRPARPAAGAALLAGRVASASRGADEAATRVGGSSARAGRSSSKKLSHGSRPPADGRNHQLRRSVALTRPLSVGVASGGSRHGASWAGEAMSVSSPSRLDSSAIACATRSSVAASPATTSPLG